MGNRVGKTGRVGVFDYFYSLLLGLDGKSCEGTPFFFRGQHDILNTV